MKSKGLFKKELLENKWIFIVGLIVLAMTALTNSLTFEMVSKLLSGPNVPKDIPFVSEQDLQSLADYTIYTWGGWFGKNFMQFGTILAVVTGMGVIAGEVSRDTITFLLTKPFSRTGVYTVKYAAGALILFVLTLATAAIQYSVALIPGHELHISFGQFMLGAVNASAVILVIFSIAVFFSTVFNDRVKAGLVSALAALALGLPSLFKYLPDFRKLADLNIYKYIGGQDILAGEGFPYISFVILLAVAAALYWVGLQVFSKKQF